MKIQAPPSKLTHKLRVLEMSMQLSGEPLDKKLISSLVKTIEYDMEHVDKHKRQIKTASKKTEKMIF